MMEKLLARRDLQFVLYEWLQVQTLTKRARFSEHNRETFDAAIDTCEQIALDHFYPINKELDANEPSFDGKTVWTPPSLKLALKQFVDAGLMAAGQDFEWGGMQLPHVVEKACFAFFKAASASASSYPFLTIANANLLLHYGTELQIKQFAKPMLAGRYFGTMCLSEPQAGSSLSDIRTKAVLQPDGTYRLFGNKMWISAGEHELSENIVHLVLAKITDQNGVVNPGVKNISLFLVPKYLVRDDGTVGEHNDVSLAGLNHKMGYRGTTNCLLNFGEGQYKPAGASGAVGQLVGQVNQGLHCMFLMMNEARIGVGLGAVMLGYAGYLHCLDYARNRPQGRAPANKDPNTAQLSIVKHADVRRMLLAQKSYVEGGLGLALYCARLVDEWKTADTPEQRQDAFELLELLTPVAKSWPSQWCLEANSLAIQVHGGYGYTRDYNVEQYYRDNRLNPIHEGTHGIQGLDLLGRKVKSNGGKAIARLIAMISATAERVEHTATQPQCAWHQSDSGARPIVNGAHLLRAQMQRIPALLRTLDESGDVDLSLANASVFLEAFGHMVVSWIWLEQALVAEQAQRLLEVDKNAQNKDQSESNFYNGKRQAVQYFLNWELTKVAPMLDLLNALDNTTLAMQDAWF
jgi:alkylation response protein AidB-like acyl-CoA dehydrogenase